MNLGPPVPATVHTKAKGTDQNLLSMLLGTASASLQTQKLTFTEKVGMKKIIRKPGINPSIGLPKEACLVYAARIKKHIFLYDL